jgi:hypothetical protein
MQERVLTTGSFAETQLSRLVYLLWADVTNKFLISNNLQPSSRGELVRA